MAKSETRDQMKEITERLEAGIKGLFTSDKYFTYLQTMSKKAKKTYGYLPRACQIQARSG